LFGRAAVVQQFLFPRLQLAFEMLDIDYSDLIISLRFRPPEVAAVRQLREVQRQTRCHGTFKSISR
jgi:hypothetical protein